MVEARPDAQKNEVWIGIDLGTVNSVVGWFFQGKPEIIQVDAGTKSVMPSMLSVKEKRGDTLLIGVDAANKQSRYPTNTFFDCKRLIGMKFSDKEIQKQIPNLPFKIVNGNLGRVRIEATISKKKVLIQPEYVSAQIISKMIRFAEKRINGINPSAVIKNAVITVPAYFNSD